MLTMITDMFFFIVGTMPLSFPQLKHHRLRIITDFLFLLWSRWLLKVICKSWAAYNTGAPVCLPNLGCAIVHSLAVYALCLKIDLVFMLFFFLLAIVLSVFSLIYSFWLLPLYPLSLFRTFSDLLYFFEMHWCNYLTFVF